ncbi:hypothetical protein BUALT_Bualt07G0031900 [Buddleja alternifolia]|uniref:Uncharacterized protein n=1 Tax=Buddleja alternifolia TaxID=168488 RepID=A0AAV6XIG4_9LAMI|nr:hypothetical protein BUALT_Bualt07G0031900 [Buddleja alternifolia]
MGRTPSIATIGGFTRSVVCCAFGELVADVVVPPCMDIKAVVISFISFKNPFNYNLICKTSERTIHSYPNVFPPPDDSHPEKGDNKEDNLVRGKRFTQEEDEVVFKYILERKLGEQGLDMVLNCKKYPNVKRCWKEIGTTYPTDYIGQFINGLKSYLEGPRIVNGLKKSVKGFLHTKKSMGTGERHWQMNMEDIDKLFSLVNYDLQLKVSEEKRSRHGMSRDNICWTAVSDKLSSRFQANCCLKWYCQLASPMVSEGLWADIDDFRLVSVLFNFDARCIEDVEWDHLLDHR